MDTTLFELIHFIGYLGFIPAVIVIVFYVVVTMLRREIPSVRIVLAIYVAVPIFLAVIFTYMNINTTEKVRREFMFDNPVIVFMSNNYKKITGRMMLPESLSNDSVMSSPSEVEMSMDADYKPVMPMNIKQKNMVKVYDILMINFFILCFVGLMLIYYKYIYKPRLY